MQKFSQFQPVAVFELICKPPLAKPWARIGSGRWPSGWQRWRRPQRLAPKSSGLTREPLRQAMAAARVPVRKRRQSQLFRRSSWPTTHSEMMDPGFQKGVVLRRYSPLGGSPSSTKGPRPPIRGTTAAPSPPTFPRQTAGSGSTFARPNLQAPHWPAHLARSAVRLLYPVITHMQV